MTPYYDHAGITIYHGDCRDILPHLPKVDLVLTDPPYNVGLSSNGFSARQSGYENSSDALSREEYGDLLGLIASRALESETAIVTCGNVNIRMWPQPTWTMAWTKKNGVSRTPLTRGQEMNHSCWEPILVYGKLSHPPVSDVLDCPITFQQQGNGHPCPKPIRLFRQLISFTDHKSILDPFMGSGTTLVAAKQLGRRAIGIEIEEKYCEIAAKRLSQEVLAFH